MVKNIVFTIHNYSGAQTYAEQIRKYLVRKEDVKFYILFFGYSGYQEFTVVEEDEVMFFYFPFPGKRKPEIYSKRVVDLLVAWFGNTQNLILHLNSPYQYWFAYHFKQRFSSRVVYTIHYLINKYTSAFLLGEVGKKVKDIAGTRKMMEISDKVICVTDFARKIYGGEWQEKLVRIYNGYESLAEETLDTVERERLREELGLAKEDVILLYVGRIDESKGCDSLVEAMSGIIRKHRNIRLIVAGDGNYKLCLKRVGLNCARIMFTGYVSHEQLTRLYRLSDVGIIPSLWEQCSYVALEMMANHLPVIYADVPGLNELFQDGYNGLKLRVLPQGKKYRLSIQPEEIVSSVERFVDYNLEQRYALGVHAYDEWKRFYRREKMGDEVYKIYNNLLKK